MGAFFLYHKNSSIDLVGARDIFERKGLAEPREFSLGQWRLLLYSKMLLNVDNFIQDDDGWAIFSSGTVVYQGLGYRESLRRLLFDFRGKCLDQEELIGSFCLFFWNKRSISILLDRSQTYHVFDNEQQTNLSSSFLAVLAASPTPLPLNRLAVYEKLSSGYIVAPDTLINGIRQVDNSCKSSYSPEKDGICFIPSLERPPIVLHNAGIAESIERQVNQLQTHFIRMDQLHYESHGELGLSSGYDSRLVLACSKYLSRPMDLHTHKTLGVHDAENGVVQEIAGSLNLSLQSTISRKMEDQIPENFSAILEDGLYFYDGRCSYNMGAFSEVYTSSYKKKVVGKHALSWNGLGGEMYRNYYFKANRSIKLRPWFDRNIYYPFAFEALGSSYFYEEMHERKVKKILHRLQLSNVNHFDFLNLRRYYSEIHMPDCDASNNDALNQLSFFHTPFMDVALVSEAINATPFIGSDGNYQAQLIKRIDEPLAAFQSHYGHSFYHIPVSRRLKSYLKAQISDTALNRRVRRILSRQKMSITSEFNALSERNPILKDFRKVLEETVMKGKFEDALLHYAQRPTTIFVASFLHSFHHKIRWD